MRSLGSRTALGQPLSALGRRDEARARLAAAAGMELSPAEMGLPHRMEAKAQRAR
ncbi:MAG: hypothetical protein JWP15_2516 [Alphaproteobacteria bacterium]|nr:hypothetical protein [Alphaproteobacteria bacterium]